MNEQALQQVNLCKRFDWKIPGSVLKNHQETVDPYLCYLLNKSETAEFIII